MRTKAIEKALGEVHFSWDVHCVGECLDEIGRSKSDLLVKAPWRVPLHAGPFLKYFVCLELFLFHYFTLNNFHQDFFQSNPSTHTLIHRSKRSDSPTDQSQWARYVLFA